MDELEFRRRATAHPTDTDPVFLAAAQDSPANRKHLEEMKQMDRHLHRALEVEVPPGLAERILLRQAMEADDEVVVPLPPPVVRSQWRSLAMAASVAFLLGMSTRWLSWPTPAPAELSLAQVAMAHVYGEEPFIEGVDEKVSLQTINAKMEKYGATLMDDLAAAKAAHGSVDALGEQYGATLAASRADAQKAVKAAKDKAARDAEKKLTKADADVAAKLAAAEADLNAAKSSAMAEIEAVAAEAARDMVARLSGASVTAAEASQAVKAVIND